MGVKFYNNIRTVKRKEMFQVIYIKFNFQTNIHWSY